MPTKCGLKIKILLCIMRIYYAVVMHTTLLLKIFENHIISVEVIYETYITIVLLW